MISDSSEIQVDDCSGSSAELAPWVDWNAMSESRHFVQFYESDDFLVEAIASFIGGGLGSGEGGVIIATRRHRDALASVFEKMGIEIKRLKSRGQFICLDAAETLSKFIINGMPDETLFTETISPVVARAGNGRGRVRAFGEMVALLWAQGNREAAVQLEKLWNGLHVSCNFSLFCAYPMNEFKGSGDAGDFAHVCCEHGAVLPSEAYASGDRTAQNRLRAIATMQQQSLSLEAENAQRRVSEEGLRRSQQELMSFIESATIGLHWVGADGIILWANAADYSLLGYSKEEYVGHHIAEFHADLDVIEMILARLSRGARLRDFEARLKCKDGSIKTVLIDSSVYWEHGRFVHTQSFTRDITESKRVEESLRHLASIVEFASDAIVSKDLNGTIMTWNKSAERIFGYEAREILGKSILLLIPENRRDEELEIIDGIRRGERFEQFETIRRHKDGTLLPVSLTISPIKNELGKIVAVAKIARLILDSLRQPKIIAINDTAS